MIKNLRMLYKTTAIFCIFVMFFAAYSAVKAQDSPSSSQENVIRVAISNSSFSSYENSKVSVSSEGPFYIYDAKTKTYPVSSLGKDIYTVSINNNKFAVSNSANIMLGTFDGPVEIISVNDTPVQIIGLKRKTSPASYRGKIELVRILNKDNKFYTLNVIPVEQYLRGVVPNELPVSFGFEALKAQAVAARNYALLPRVKPNKQYDICDSQQCQVYYGYNSEHPLSDKAIEETKGLLALYQGEPILALYSSTAGGYTESYENVFSDPVNKSFPSKPKPYLKGKPDIEGMPPLDNEDFAKGFYSSIPPCFDNESSYFRWNRAWTKAEMEAVLNKNLPKYASGGFIFPKITSDFNIGSLISIEVVSRGVSGKALAVRIISTSGNFLVQKESFIRKIFENGGKGLPSANIVFNNIYDELGNLQNINIQGGGFGHGVGMSQWGAGFMSKKGYSFDQILKHYYDGISIGTMPLNLASLKEPVKQEFQIKDKGVELILENISCPEKIKIFVNSSPIEIPLCYQNVSLAVTLDKYLVNGKNEIVIFPSSENKTLKARIEVIPADKQNQIISYMK